MQVVLSAHTRVHTGERWAGENVPSSTTGGVLGYLYLCLWAMGQAQGLHREDRGYSTFGADSQDPDRWPDAAMLFGVGGLIDYLL